MYLFIRQHHPHVVILEECVCVIQEQHFVDVVHVELYTDKKDPVTEARLEGVLDRHDIFYDKSEVWIESEKLYEVLYTFERKVNDGE